MIANIYNQNFGYTTTCQGNWAAIGNPSIIRYNPNSASIIRTGSIEIYKYNINTDTHDRKAIIYRPLTDYELILLSTETTASNVYILHTEPTGSVPFSANLDLQLDDGEYYSPQDDAYGFSIDINDNLLAVGNLYFSSSIIVTSGSVFFPFTGSGYVDIFDLSKFDIDPYAQRILPVIVNYNFGTGFALVGVSVPGGQNYRYVDIQTKRISIPDDTWQTVVRSEVTSEGGLIFLQTNYTSTDLIDLDVRVVGVVGTDPYLVTISNPNTSMSESFGWSVSMNDEWLAVSSIYESGSKGGVYIYQKYALTNDSWSLYQSLTLPSDVVAGDKFGFSLDMNKSSGSYNYNLVIGTSRATSSKVYVYELVSGSWDKKFTLSPDNTTVYPLTFYPTLPLFSGSYPNTADGFGYDVATYGDTIVIGAPTDRYIYEYSGSSVYQQGAVYFYERCGNRDYGYYLARKSYGNEKIMKNNMLGWSVGVFDDYAVAGAPKITINENSICYLQGSLFQNHYCEAPTEETLDGQYVLYQKTTGSIPDSTFIDWDLVNVYQIKKRYLQPYRAYGFDVSICDDFIVVGAPMLISGSNTIMNMSPSTGSFSGNIDDIGDLSGKAYIYNLKNLKESFYVGNVFYRNGKLVVMTSGSAFEGLFLDDTSEDNYEYDIRFKSKQMLFEKQVVCPVDLGEFNVSTNPTAIILPTASLDVNGNGSFDFQDTDILLRYMKYKSTEATGNPITDWSSSIVDTTTDEEASVYNMYASQYDNTDYLFTQYYTNINDSLYSLLDFNDDNKIDSNDMYILWKYFIYRLTQKNYETYITPNSEKTFLSDILDFLNIQTQRDKPPLINSNFLDYGRLSNADPTGSYLAPYVTSVGLYNGTDLVAIAKLGSPIKITPDFPMNFVVKMDF